MKKTIVPILLILAIVLSACGTSENAEATADPSENSGDESGAPDSGDSQTAEGGDITSQDNPCADFSLLDQTLANPYPELPPATKEDWAVGPEDAAATFMEYSEPQCPYCAQIEPLMVAIQQAYPQDVRIIYRHRPFPESFHDKSFLASQALEAAGKQGRFQELKNFLFERQSKNPNSPTAADLPDSEFWVSVSPDDFDEWLAERVPDLGIEADQFLDDMFSKEVETKIQEAKADADALGINGTPTLFINGYKWPEEQRGIEIFSIYTELLINRAREYDSCPEMVIDTEKTYSATLVTSKGDITVELYDDVAPYAVNSFVFLAREGWYDGLPFIVSDQFVLSGDPSDTGYGGPGYVTLDEISDELTFEEPGVMAVFSLGSGLNGSTFFINKTTLTEQEGRTVFGKVIEGMDVVNSMEARDNIFEPAEDQLLSVTITEK